MISVENVTSNYIWNLFEDIKDTVKRSNSIDYNTGAEIMRVCERGQELMKALETKEKSNGEIQT